MNKINFCSQQLPKQDFVVINGCESTAVDRKVKIYQ